MVNLETRAILGEFHTQGAAINAADHHQESNPFHVYSVVLVLYQTVGPQGPEDARVT